MLNFKKLLCLILVVFNIFLIFTYNVSASGDINVEERELVCEAVYVGEENGCKVYEAVIPIEWHSYTKAETPETRVSDCYVSMYYAGNGVWHYYLTYTGLALIKYLNGNLTTYGVAGTTSTTLYESNLIPGPTITAEAELHHLHPLQSGKQYFKVSGTVTGVNGYGSFGPQTTSVDVNPD